MRSRFDILGLAMSINIYNQKFLSMWITHTLTPRARIICCRIYPETHANPVIHVIPYWPYRPLTTRHPAGNTYPSAHPNTKSKWTPRYQTSKYQVRRYPSIQEPRIQVPTVPETPIQILIIDVPNIQIPTIHEPIIQVPTQAANGLLPDA